MKSILKKICICGASLMMISSLSTGINNTSASKTNRHARTRRIVQNYRSLYKQGEHDSKSYAYALDISPSSRPKIYNHIINEIIKNRFNKSYIKGLNLLKLGRGGAYAGADYRVPIDILSDAKKVARHRSNIAKHRIKYHVKRVPKNNQRYHKIKRNYNSAFKKKMINEYKRHRSMFGNGMDDVVFGMLDGGVNSYSVVRYNHINNKYYRDGWIASLSIASNYKDQMDFNVNPFIHNLDRPNSLKNLAKARKAWNKTVREAKKNKNRHGSDKYISIPALKLEHYSNSDVKQIAKETRMTGSDF